MNTGMSSEARNEFDVKYEDRVQRIREAAAVAIRQLDQLRAARPMTQGVPDAEVTRIVQEKLQHRGCGVVVHRGDGWHNSFCHEGPGRRNSDTISSRIVANTPTDQHRKRRPALWSWILEERRWL